MLVLVYWHNHHKSLQNEGGRQSDECSTHEVVLLLTQVVQRQTQKIRHDPDESHSCTSRQEEHGCSGRGRWVINFTKQTSRSLYSTELKWTFCSVFHLMCKVSERRMVSTTWRMWYWCDRSHLLRGAVEVCLWIISLDQASTTTFCLGGNFTNPLG